MTWPKRVLEAQLPLTLCSTCFANQPDEPGEWIDGDDKGGG